MSHVLHVSPHLEPGEVNLEGVGDQQPGAEDDGQRLAQVVQAGRVRAPGGVGLHEGYVEQRRVRVHELSAQLGGVGGYCYLLLLLLLLLFMLLFCCSCCC